MLVMPSVEESEKCVFTYMTFRKVILQKSIVEEDTLYKMILMWEQFGQAANHYIVTIYS